jgi:hypothetical protein
LRISLDDWARAHVEGALVSALAQAAQRTVHGWPRVPGNNSTVYYVLIVQMIVFLRGKKCVGIEGGDGFPWRKGPSADGEGLGPVLDASRRGTVPLGDQR